VVRPFGSIAEANVAEVLMRLGALEIQSMQKASVEFRCPPDNAIIIVLLDRSVEEKGELWKPKESTTRKRIARVGGLSAGNTLSLAA
jgi:hypothetical protein